MIKSIQLDLISMSNSVKFKFREEDYLSVEEGGGMKTQ